MRATNQASKPSIRWPWVLGSICLMVILLAALLPRAVNGPTAPPTAADAARSSSPNASGTAKATFPSYRPSSMKPTPTAEDIVSNKVVQFAHDRLAITRAMARKFNVQLTPDVEQFFAAAEAGRWEELQRLFGSLRERRSRGQALTNDLWEPILETFGAAEVAHDWPARRLLDYGQAVLGSLRPGMVYVGGTDPGRFIPTLLNETGADERHIILTQNALSDGNYLNYFDFLYHDQLSTLSEQDSQRAISDYTADAEKRFNHDQQFPNEPRQIRPGEDVRLIDGRVQVAGHLAVMDQNEKLFQMLMDKNPDFSFAMEESFPFKSTYPAAVPLGPILELRNSSGSEGCTPERAAQAVAYWGDTAQQLLSDPDIPPDSNPRLAYAKMASAQASLFAEHNLNDEAGQAFRIATDIAPGSPEAVFRYVNFLMQQNRPQDAIQIAQAAATAAPSNDQFRDLADRLRSFMAKKQ
jgi:hypothetical protein